MTRARNFAFIPLNADHPFFDQPAMDNDRHGRVANYLYWKDLDTPSAHPPQLLELSQGDPA
jgi:hypothetical protein